MTNGDRGDRMAYYPIYLDLRDRVCVAVGGGSTMEDKVRGLIRSQASVRLIAEKLTPGLQRLAEQGAFEHLGRSYQPGDLEHAVLVISEGGEPTTNEVLRREANALNIPLNVIDEPSHSTFIAPATVHRGDLTVAISTSGKAPALAVRLRQELEERLGSHHARFLQMAGLLRKPLVAHHPDFEQRRRLWYTLVDSEILELLRRGKEERAWDRVTEIVGFRPEVSG